MNGLRKGLVFILCPLLFVTLLLAAASLSANLNLRDPAQIESWLVQSKVYDHFVTNVAKVSVSQLGDNNSNGSVSISDTAVQNAAESAWSSEQIQQYVKTILDGNYAWLEGKTPKPVFVVDLSGSKTTFAQKVGQYVTAYSANLPVCTAAQEAQAKQSDPLTATCRPSNKTPEQLGAEVTKNLESGDFLNTAVITADSVDANDQTQAQQPYYKKLQHLPRIYQLSVYTPYVMAVLSLIYILGLIFLSSTRRGGFKKTAWVLTIAGAVLVIGKFTADIAFNQFVKSAFFHNAQIGELKVGITAFARLVQQSVSNTEMYIGIGYLVVAIIIFVALMSSRNRGNKKPKQVKPVSNAPTPPSATQLPEQKAPQPQPTPAPVSTTPRYKTSSDPTGSRGPTSTAPTLAGTTKPKKPKRPRLIQ